MNASKIPEKYANVEVPPNVVNLDAYYKYLEICDNPYFKSDSARLVQTSDTSLVVDVGAMLPHLMRQVEHLPDNERRNIIARCKLVQGLRSRKTQLHKQAFGIKKENTYLDDMTELDPRKGELVSLFGSFNSIDDVYKVVVGEWKLPVTHKQVKMFSERYSSEISNAREEFKRDYAHVRLGYKRSRLEEYSYMYTRNKERLESNSFKDSSLIKLNMEILKSIKDEVEGSELNVNINGEVNVNHTVQTYLDRDVLAKMPVQCIVLSKLSARFGLNPNLLMHRLNTSIYAKNLGIVQADNNLKDIEVMYPSNHVYEFDKLRRLNDNVNIEEAQIIDDADKSGESTRTEADMIKAAALATLQTRKEEATQAVVRVKIKKRDK